MAQTSHGKAQSAWAELFGGKYNKYMREIINETDIISNILKLI